MSRISKHIYYNINESDIELTYKNLILYFSSEFNADRFQTKIIDFINEENHKLKIKYGICVEFSEMLILAYYQKIEKRGFRVLKKLINLKNNEIYLKEINKDDIIISKVGE